MKTTTILASLAALALASVHAAPPSLIGHQGRITVNNINHDGSGYFKFALVDGGATETFWTNDGTNTGTPGGEPTAAVTLTVDQGHYSLNLGDTGLTNMTALDPATFVDNDDLSLRIWFSTAPGGPFELLSPDRRLTAAAYALSAANAGGIPGVTSLSGNIGIGTSSPDERLSVAGNIRLNNNSLLFRGSGDDFHGLAHQNAVSSEFTPATIDGIDGPILWGFDGGALGSLQQSLNNIALTWKANGNVGIGTDNPAAELHVNGSGWFGPDTGVLASSAGPGVRVFVNPGDSPPTGNLFAYDYSTNSPLTLKLQEPGGNVGINGNLGIGTFDPQGRLDVNSGGSPNDALLVKSNIGVVGYGGIIHHQGSTNAWQEVTASTAGLQGLLRYRYVERANPDTIVKDNVLVLRGDGQVGIGTDAPAAALHVFNGSSGGAIVPSADAIIEDDDGARLQINGGDSTDSGIFFGRTGVFNHGGIVYGGAANQLFFYAGGGPERMTIAANGNVGIGTTDPGTDLHVLGSGFFGPDSGGLPLTAGPGVRFFFDEANNVGQIYAWDYTTAPFGTSRNLAIQSGLNSGNLGVGTTNPGEKLEVAGNVKCATVIVTSDRDKKDGFAEVDAREILDKVAAMPITRWHYKAETGVPHIGPMAQDFHAAFGVGPDDKHIATVDADGIALAAIKGLNEVVAEKDAEIDALKEKVAAMEARFASLEQALESRN